MEWISVNDINITQGSIVDGVKWDFFDDDPASIILSNACDLAHNHSSYLIVAALFPANHVIMNSREIQGIIGQEAVDLTKKQKEAVGKTISDYIHHKTINRYYFIDCTHSDLGMPMVVDFQLIKSIPIEQKDDLHPIANLVSPLKEQMMIQYACYTARIPSDRVSGETEERLIKEIAAGKLD